MRGKNDPAIARILYRGVERDVMPREQAQRIRARIGEIVVERDVVCGLKRDVGGAKGAYDRAGIDVRAADPIRPAANDIDIRGIEQPGPVCPCAAEVSTLASLPT